jgi:Protein of unknown function (DUF3738)
MNDGRGRVNATQIDMGMLARELGGVMGIAVVDQTALQGAYDIKLIWDPDQDAPTPATSALPSLFAALQQIGLKLNRAARRSRCWWLIMQRRLPQLSDQSHSVPGDEAPNTPPSDCETQSDFLFIRFAPAAISQAAKIMLGP